jgi:tRNA (adenine-N(1)-)-methyltransferase non-catalytic subunit
MEDVQPQVQVDTVAEASTARPHPNSRKPKDAGPLEPLDEILRRRLTVIKEGDNVLLKLPSDSIKAVVASKDG